MSIENRHKRIEYLIEQAAKHGGDYGRGLKDAMNIVVNGEEIKPANRDEFVKIMREPVLNETSAEKENSGKKRSKSGQYEMIKDGEKD